jgi:hypothetical protein
MKIKIKKKTIEESSGVAGMTGFAGKVPEDSKEIVEKYEAEGKCVYKDDGSKVGCTDSNVGDYLKALYANVEDANEGKLDELYSTSGINMMGAGLKQIDPTPEQENERYDMNYINKRLQNYKPSLYFTEESDKKQRKIKITIKKH